MKKHSFKLIAVPNGKNKEEEKKKTIYTWEDLIICHGRRVTLLFLSSFSIPLSNTHRFLINHNMLLYIYIYIYIYEVWFKGSDPFEELKCEQIYNYLPNKWKYEILSLVQIQVTRSYTHSTILYIFSSIFSIILCCR